MRERKRERNEEFEEGKKGIYSYNNNILIEARSQTSLSAILSIENSFQIGPRIYFSPL